MKGEGNEEWENMMKSSPGDNLNYGHYYRLHRIEETWINLFKLEKKKNSLAVPIGRYENK